LMAVPPEGGVDIGPHGMTGAIIILWWHFQRLEYCLPACLVLLIVNISGALSVPPPWDLIPILSKIVLSWVIPKQATPPSVVLVGRTTIFLALLTGAPSSSPKELMKETPTAHCGLN